VNSREIRIRTLVESAFFLCLFGAFLWEALGNYFCSESGRGMAARQSLNIALVMTLWDSIASVCGLSVAWFLRESASARAVTIWISAGVAAIGYFGAISILWPGRQLGPFGSALDCSCFFTEGYGMLFPITWAPLLVIATIVREWLTGRIVNRQARTGEQKA